jgi:hypothetical protein
VAAAVALFKRERHAAIALLLDAIDADVLVDAQCYLWGGAALAMPFGEWRETTNIDLVIADGCGYRELRQSISERGIRSMFHTPIVVSREPVTDQYGIQAVLESTVGPVRLKISYETRMPLERPSVSDNVCGVRALTVADLVASKLLAIDDRWQGPTNYSRDLIDLAVLKANRTDWISGHSKARGTYGDAVDDSLRRAVEFALYEPGWLDLCVHQMKMDIDVGNLRPLISGLAESA